MNDIETLLATVGDLELTRRKLLQEINDRDQQIEALQQQLAEQNGNLDDGESIPIVHN